MASKNVEVRLSANVAAYKAGMADASRSTDQLDASTTKTTSSVGSKWQKASKEVTGSMIPSYAAVGVAAGAMALATINAASDLSESINAVNVSYGEVSGAVHKLGADSVEQFGLSERAFNEAAVGFTNFATDVAGEKGNVVGTLEELMLRSTDFASVMNMEVPEAAAAFKSALSGEAEPLKAFGINISDAAVKAYALEQGLVGVGETMTDQEKVQARYGLLMQETAKVQGDFANTSGGYANTLKMAKANVENLAAAMGSLLLPVVTDAVGMVSDLVLKLQELAKTPAIKVAIDIGQGGEMGQEGGDGSAFPLLNLVREPWDRSVGQWIAWANGSDEAAESLNTHTGKVHLANEATGEWLKAQQEATEATRRANFSMDEATVAVSDYWHESVTMGDIINGVVAAHNEETEAIQEKNTAAQLLTDSVYAAADAEDAWWAQLVETNAILADTEVSERDKAASTRDMALATRDAAATQLAANGVDVDSVAGRQMLTEAMLENAAALSGPVQTEVLNYIGLMNGIPEEKLTEILTDANPDDLAQVQAELDAVAAPRTMTVNVEARIPAALRAIMNAGGNVQLMTGNNAEGTQDWRGGLTWVGERGPELVALPQHSKVFTAQQSAAMTTGGGSNLTINHYGPNLSAADVSRGYTLARLAQVA